LEATAEGGQTPPLRLSNAVRGGGSGLIDLRELIAAGPQPSSDVLPGGEGKLEARRPADQERGSLPLGPTAGEASSASGTTGASASSLSGRFTAHAGASSAAASMVPLSSSRQPFWVTALLILGALVALG